MPAAARAAARCSLSRTASWYNRPFSSIFWITPLISCIPAWVNHVNVEYSWFPLLAVVQLTDPWMSRDPTNIIFVCWMPGKDPDRPTAA